jgi:hypothetical protein
MSALPQQRVGWLLASKFKDVFANNDAAPATLSLDGYSTGDDKGFTDFEKQRHQPARAFPARADFSGEPIQAQAREGPLKAGRVQIVSCVPSSTTRPGGSR